LFPRYLGLLFWCTFTTALSHVRDLFSSGLFSVPLQ
jgi:hypothetical protein